VRAVRRRIRFREWPVPEDSMTAPEHGDRQLRVGSRSWRTAALGTRDLKGDGLWTATSRRSASPPRFPGTGHSPRPCLPNVISEATKTNSANGSRCEIGRSILQAIGMSLGRNAVAVVSASPTQLSGSLVAQSINGVELGRATRRKVAEDDANDGRERKRHRVYPRIEQVRHLHDTGEGY